MSLHGHSLGTSGVHAGTDDASRIHREQEKHNVENRLRVLRNHVTEKAHALHDVERSTQMLDAELRHVLQEEKQLEEEIRRRSLGVRQGEGASKQSESLMREVHQDIDRKKDEINKIERDIMRLRASITEKETAVVALKQEMSKLMGEKEEFRRAHEHGNLSTKSDTEHVRERQVRLILLKQERKRKENEIAHKLQIHQELKREINLKNQELLEVEAELRKLNTVHG